MGRDASFELNCSRFSDRILEIVKLLIVSGWTFLDEDDQVEYLPLGDSGDYQWQIDAIAEGRLYELIERKQDRAEMVGLVMYYRDTDVGITLLAESTEAVIIMPNINRRTLDDNDDSLTDMSWYAERIILKLMWRGCRVDSVKFEEYEG